MKYTKKVQHKFYLQNQKTAFNGSNWCEPGVSMGESPVSVHHSVCTEQERTSLGSVVYTGCPSKPVRTMETQ